MLLQAGQGGGLASLGGGGTDLPSYYEQHGGFLVVYKQLDATFTLQRSDFVLVHMLHGSGHQPPRHHECGLGVRARIDHGELDVVVFTSAAVPFALIEETDVTTWLHAYAVNAVGVDVGPVVMVGVTLGSQRVLVGVAVTSTGAWPAATLSRALLESR